MGEMERRPKANRRVIGPYSSAGAMSLIDGRTRQALFMQRLRKKLLDQVGGDPSITQRQLIERVVRLSMQVEIFDAKFFKDGCLSDCDQRQHLAYSNALSRTLAKLSVNTKSPPKVARPRREMIEDDIVFSISSNTSPAEPEPKKSRFRKVKGLKIKTVVTTRPGFKSVIDHVVYPKPKPPPSPRSTEVGSFQTGVVDLVPERS